MTLSCTLGLPCWVSAFLEAWDQTPAGDEEAMRLAVALARENILRGSGGPFAAVVIDESGALLGTGVNGVTALRLSVAHAEIVALSLAQQKLGDWNLARYGELTLVTTCEPCAMCLGALPWSGVRHLVCGARAADAEAAGFDEGDKPRDWVGSLTRRGIRVRRDVLRESAERLFGLYLKQGGEIYNAFAETGDNP